MGLPVVAAARHGLAGKLSLEHAYAGNAYADPDAPRVPANSAYA